MKLRILALALTVVAVASPISSAQVAAGQPDVVVGPQLWLISDMPTALMDDGEGCWAGSPLSNRPDGRWCGMASQLLVDL
jgi:hypothetical protein